MLQQADAVYVFDHENYRAAVSEHAFPEQVHCLAALADDGPLSISDPFGGPASEYELVYRQIAAGSKRAHRRDLDRLACARCA